MENTFYIDPETKDLYLWNGSGLTKLAPISISEIPNKSGGGVTSKSVMPDKKDHIAGAGKKVRRCKKCGMAGHRSDNCTTSGRLAKKAKQGAKDFFSTEPKVGACPIDEDTYILIKQKKDQDYGATEIASMLEVERDTVADAMISPSWEDFSSRFEK